MDTDTIQKQIIEEFSTLEAKLDKYDRLISLGKSLPHLDEAYRTDDDVVSGCQSKVWISSKMQNGRLRFYADSDAMITRGMIALLMRVLNDQPPQKIVDCDLFFIDAIGLNSSLSPARSNGLQAMVKKMRADAAALVS
jgi:cysteine desulfuration protein SufE